MGSGWPGPGVNHVPEYMVSGAPWVTGSLAVGTSTPVLIEFPNVTKFFTVKNNGSGVCRVGFTSAGVQGSKYYAVSGTSVKDFDLRIKNIFLLATGSATTVDVLGGLTAIAARSYLTLTGANPPPTGSWFLPGVE